ncbi:MAG: alpha/beta fold hydrolase [Balneolales bacterium]
MFLHGFMGSGEQFLHLIPHLQKSVNPVTLEITCAPGNGLDASTYTSDAAVFDVETLCEGLQHVIQIHLHQRSFVLGYSMGGRLALSWAVRYPDQPLGLIFESSTAGIVDAAERKQRMHQDKKQAKAILRDYPAFLKEWEQNSLFASPSSALNPASLNTRVKKLAAIHQSRDPKLMARWLTDFGTGVMPSVWDRIDRLKCPVLLITGSRDQKFCSLAQRIKTHLPNARHEIVSHAAHRVHIDAPDAYLEHVSSFLSNIS